MRRPGQVLGAHHGEQIPRRAHMRRISDAHAGGVLQRNPTARMNRFRLRKEKRALLSGGLRGIKPLQTGSAGRGRVMDAHARRFRGQRDGQRRTQKLVGVAQLERARFITRAVG